VNGEDKVVPVTVKKWPQELWESYNSETMRSALTWRPEALRSPEAQAALANESSLAARRFRAAATG
jgi:hypothetical protein